MSASKHYTLMERVGALRIGGSARDGWNAAAIAVGKSYDLEDMRMEDMRIE